MRILAIYKGWLGRIKTIWFLIIKSWSVSSFQPTSLNTMESTASHQNLVVCHRAYMVEGNESIITARFFQPEQDDAGFYRCEYEFLGEGAEKYSGISMGLDSVEAMDNAFWLAGTVLANLNETLYGGKLHWEGAEPCKPVGLPVISGNKYPFKDY